MRQKRDAIPIEVARVVGSALAILSLFYAARQLYEFILSFGTWRKRPPVDHGIHITLSNFGMLLDALRLLGAWVMLIAGIVVLRRPTWLIPALYAFTLGSLLIAITSLYSLVNFALRAPLGMQLYVSLSELAQLPLLGVVTLLVLRRMRARNEAAQDAPVCEKCGYAMRGLAEPRCPECGRVYTLDEFHAL